MISKEKPLSFAGSIFAPCLLCSKNNSFWTRVDPKGFAYFFHSLTLSLSLSLSLSHSLSLSISLSLYLSLVRSGASREFELSSKSLDYSVNASCAKEQPEQLQSKRNMILNRFNESINTKSIYRYRYICVSTLACTLWVWTAWKERCSHKVSNINAQSMKNQKNKCLKRCISWFLLLGFNTKGEPQHLHLVRKRWAEVQAHCSQKIVSKEGWCWGMDGHLKTSSHSSLDEWPMLNTK